MCPAARLARKAGTVNGDSRRVPLVSTVRTASAIAGNPPIPVAITVAVRSCARASAGVQPACATASAAASSANRMKRSIFLWSLRGAARSGSNPPSASSALSDTIPATRAGRLIAQSGNVLSPDCPDSSRDQTNSVPQPSGDTVPRARYDNSTHGAPVGFSRDPAGMGWKLYAHRDRLYDNRHLLYCSAERQGVPLVSTPLVWRLWGGLLRLGSILLERHCAITLRV
jgi:hypothetical protein